MCAQWLNIGLVFGMLGVVVIFLWGWRCDLQEGPAHLILV